MIGSNVSIFRKGLLLVCLPIGLQLVILVGFLRLQASADEANHWAVHTKEVMATAEEGYRMVCESVAQIRGAIITSKDDFTPELVLSEDRVLPTFDHLRFLISDNPVQIPRADELKATATQILRRVAQEREMVRGGRAADAAALVATHVAQNGMENLHALLTSMLDEEQRLDIIRLGRVDFIRRQQYWLIAVAVVLTAALAAAVLWLFTRNVAQRLAMLAENAANLAARRALSARVEGSDEIGRVDDAFHAAAAQLADADQVEQRYRGELERRAAELAGTNAELARSNGDLRFKTQEIETFVYSVSHDLRSPLVNLQGFSKELASSCEDLRTQINADGVPAETRERIVDLIDSDVLQSVRFIQTAVSRSSNIIDALLRLSRAGQLDYKRQRVETAAIAARVVEAMQSSIRAKEAEVIVNELPDTESDPTAVEQIFGNLVGNAVNYLDAKRPGRIEIGAMPSDNAGLVKYYVRDNGLGIPAAYLPKMFVAFQRLHGQVAAGEGIGLAMVRRMVDRLGGAIWVESVQNEGSTFFVTLPAIDAERGTSVSTAAGPAYSAGTAKKE